jgi:hypothetical protein
MACAGMTALRKKIGAGSASANGGKWTLRLGGGMAKAGGGVN